MRLLRTPHLGELNFSIAFLSMTPVAFTLRTFWMNLKQK